MSEQNLPVPPEFGRLSAFIDSHTECLAGASSELRSIALCTTKHVFDWALATEKHAKPHLKTVLAALTEVTPPQTRLRARRGPSPVQQRQKQIDLRETPLPSLLVEGMNADQIWQQLDLRAARVCEHLRALQGGDEDKGANLNGEGTDDEESEDEEDEGEDDDDDEDTEMDVDEGFLGELSEEEENGSSTEGAMSLQEEISEDEDDHQATSMLDMVTRQQRPKRAYPGHSDLDDGFFDLAMFNAETDNAETREVPKRKLSMVTDEDSTDESEVDLFGSVDDSGIRDVDVGLGQTELFYNDFFDPPPRVQTKSIRQSKVRFHERVSVKKIKAVGKCMPLSSMADEDCEEDEDGDASSSSSNSSSSNE